MKLRMSCCFLLLCKYAKTISQILQETSGQPSLPREWRPNHLVLERCDLRRQSAPSFLDIAKVPSRSIVNKGRLSSATRASGNRVLNQLGKKMLSPNLFNLLLNVLLRHTACSAHDANDETTRALLPPERRGSRNSSEI